MRPRQIEISQIELLAAMERPNVRIHENTKIEGEPVRGWFEGETISIGRRLHERSAYGHDMVSTFLHEMLHYLRPSATERWIKRREMHWFADDKVRAAAAIRLLNAVLFDVPDKE